MIHGCSSNARPGEHRLNVPSLFMPTQWQSLWWMPCSSTKLLSHVAISAFASAWQSLTRLREARSLQLSQYSLSFALHALGLDAS